MCPIRSCMIELSALSLVEMTSLITPGFAPAAAACHMCGNLDYVGDLQPLQAGYTILHRARPVQNPTKSVITVISSRNW